MKCLQRTVLSRGDIYHLMITSGCQIWDLHFRGFGW